MERWTRYRASHLALAAIIIAWFALIAICQLNADVKWVNKRAVGSGDGSDSTNAYATIALLNSNAVAGRTFYITGGHYTDANLNPALGGTSGNRVRIIASDYAGSWASPDSGGSSKNVTIGTNDASIHGVDLTGASSGRGDYITVIGIGMGELGLFSTYPNYANNDSIYACRIYTDIGIRGAKDNVIAYCTVGDSTAADGAYITFVGSGDEQGCTCNDYANESPCKDNNGGPDNCYFELSNGEGDGAVLSWNVSNYTGSWRDTLRHCQLWLGTQTNDNRRFSMRCDARDNVIDSNTVVSYFTPGTSGSADINPGVYMQGGVYGTEFKDNRWTGLTIDNGSTPAGSNRGNRSSWFILRDYIQFNSWTRDTFDMALNDTTDIGGFDIAVGGACDGSTSIYNNTWRKCIFRSAGGMYNQTQGVAYATFDSCTFYTVAPTNIRHPNEEAGGITLNGGYAWTFTHNTFVTSGGPALQLVKDKTFRNPDEGDGVSPPFDKSRFLNNIFYRLGTHKTRAANHTGVVYLGETDLDNVIFDYNLYYQTGNDSTEAISTSEHENGITLQEWRGISSNKDFHSRWGEASFQTVAADSFYGALFCASRARGVAQAGGTAGAWPVASTPPGQFTDVADVPASATTTTITLTWTAPANFGNFGGEILGYDVRYFSGAIQANVEFPNETNWGSATRYYKGWNAASVASPGAQQTFQATGLSDDTFYNWAARPINVCGTLGPISNAVCSVTRRAAGTPHKTCE